MQKTYSTSKSKPELLRILVEGEERGDEAWRRNGLPISVKDHTTIQVKSGKSVTEWMLDLDVPGEITVRRCRTVFDLITILPLLVTDAVIAAVLFAGGWSFRKLGLLLVLILAETLVLYWGRVTNPASHIKEFITKYLT